MLMSASCILGDLAMPAIYVEKGSFVLNRADVVIC